jgi:hypothetical protein
MGHGTQPTQWMILRHSQLAPDGAEDVQPLLIFPRMLSSYQVVLWKPE